jgi:hypothetical protein
LKERTSATLQAMMRFSSQSTEHQDERSWMPNEVDGPRTKPEEPGTRITGKCASRAGSASSRSMPTGIRSIAARRSERNPKPGQAMRFPPGPVAGARRIFDCSRTLHPHTDFSMREVGAHPPPASFGLGRLARPRKRDHRPHRPTVRARRESANLGPLRVSWKANRRLTQTGACVHHPGIELEKMRRIS